ncbi:MAG: c-type cytochrome [Ignavibacteriae bacterium]|nr:c-type cytochrome [Ignavibacteriota bacterium]
MKKPFPALLMSCIAITVGFVVVFLLATKPLKGSQPSQPLSGNPGLGKNIFDSRCAVCHGANGDGKGIVAVNLHPKPRDFTKGLFKFRSTESGSIPTVDDLARIINEGIHGTAMVGWKEFITGDSLQTLIAYIQSFSTRFQNEQPKPVSVSNAIPSSVKSISDGKIVYEKLECASCHGTAGDGTDAIARDFNDEWGNIIAATNLTEPWTFRSGASASDIYLRLKTGIDGTPMPSYSESASEQDLWNLANFVASLGRKPAWQMNENELQTHYSKLDETNKSNPVQRGKYLVEVFGCADCHSPFTEGRSVMEQFRMAGGSRWRIGPYGDFYTPNLTSDKETGLGNWTDEEIKEAITKGIVRGGRRMLPFPMGWTGYSMLTKNDLNAIVAYLRTIPPVHNKIPEPEPLNIFSYMWGKFKMLILKEDFPIIIYPENSGQAQATSQTNTSNNNIALKFEPVHTSGKAN